MTEVLRSVFILVLLLLAACSPGALLRPAGERAPFHVLAVLPTEVPSGVQRERVDFLHQTLVTELRARGYSVLEDALVSRVCGSPGCPAKEVLAASYGADGLASLTLEAVAKNEFIAGYYHVVRGSLVIDGPSGDNLLNVKHSESEKGGVLFNTGQLFQGFISGAKSINDSDKVELAQKFVTALVAKLPRPAPPQVENSPTNPEIRSIQVKSVAPKVVQICATATPRMMAYLSLGRLRSNLREVGVGNYCGRYFLSSESKDAGIELRSAVGSVTRKQLSLQTSKQA